MRERTKPARLRSTRNCATAYIQTIRALAEAIDAKDAYTRGHSERVARLLVEGSRARWGCAKEMIERIYFSGLLHDVGKIGVPRRDHH